MAGKVNTNGKIPVEYKKPAHRPRKTTMEMRLNVYTLHLAGFWAPQIVPILKRQYGVEVSVTSVGRIVRMMRNRIPRFQKPDDLNSAIDACDRRNQELAIAMAELKTTELDQETKKTKTLITNHNAYLGYLKEAGRNAERKAELLGLKGAFEVELGEKTVKGLHDLMAGKWRPKLPEDIPEGAKRAIEGEEEDDG